ncbi:MULTISPECIES: hypothetical protein [unclassified Pseudoalteromonas]|uniref:hypothetical protein n=1 Tax=unclassified Pseudoalteromonas TaxID=194690 RepID=UPI000CF61535|nr:MULTISPECIES: hypothetical protein [unclassified Pseudoalteromonas]TMO27543.1 hypothetical protein CWC28_11655 [Pseudoalteromonas sp. S4492]
MKYSIPTFLLCTLVSLTACKSTKQQQTQAIALKPTPPIALNAVHFALGVEADKVQRDCVMLDKLASSITDSAKKYLVTLVEQQEKSKAEYVVEAKYIEINSHRWVFPSVRPSSSATLHVQLKKGDEIIAKTTKEIGSGVAFGACDRLEKIAVAGGRYVSKWTSNQFN